MPVLELIGEAREDIDTYSVTVMSVMLFPLEEQAAERRNWLAVSRANCYRIWKKSGASPAFLAPFHDDWKPDHLWELPQSPERVFTDGIERSRRARYSGGILKCLLSLAQHHPEHCRVEKSLALLREQLRRNGFIPPSESLLQKAWPEFKAVSHLWYARLLWQAVYKAAGVQNNVEDNADWQRLLSLAEECRRVAESLRLLSPGKTWRAPEGLLLKPPELEIAPLPPELLEFLNSQFPPPR